MEAWNSIYCKTYNFVYLRAKAVLKKEEDIQQVVKDVYLKLAAEDVKEDELYKWLAQQTYIMGCARFRTKKAREANVVEWDQQACHVQKNVDKTVTKELIFEALSQLPDMYQATLFAYYYDHMDLKEVAVSMGYNVGVIKNRLNYVHKYIEKSIENYHEEKKEKVQFSVEILCEALKEWAENNTVNLTVAQNMYANLCKELGLEMEEGCLEGESAGWEKRAKECEDEVQAIYDALSAYNVKKTVNKKTLAILLGCLGAAVVGILVFVLIQNIELPKKDKQDENQLVIEENEKEPEEDTDENKIEIQEPTEEEGEESEEPVEENVPENTADSSYILPNSNTVKLTREDLQGLSKEQLRLARNEIFARHGMIFGVADLDAYFGAKSWYQPRYTSSEFERNVNMGTIEEANVSFILQIESEIE